MAEDTSIVTKPRDYSDVAKFDLAKLHDPAELQALLDSPATYIAEAVTGALAVGKTGTTAAAGRIVQGILKGRAFKQFGAEFKKLRDAGKIPDDFAERKYGFQTWVELMAIIDEDSPDADRLEALKAMFYEVNRVSAADGQRLAAYHLWQLVKSLSSGELFLLRAVFEARFSYPETYFNYGQWEAFFANKLGHNVKGLVRLNEKRLMDLELLSNRRGGDMSEVNPENARLTDLGCKLCKTAR
ncbi:MAG: hypothetical protein ACLGPM_00090 [Acidobacteriota bacterium]